MGSFARRNGRRKSDWSGSGITRREALALAALGLIPGSPGAPKAAGPQDQLIWGVHISLAPTWFDPAEAPGLITPFMVMYALHAAIVQPIPPHPFAPSPPHT